MNEKCSTPEFGHKNISLNFSLSEIRGDKKIEKKSKSTKKQQQQQQQQQAHDPYSDSDYETVDVREIYYHESLADDETTDNIIRENSGSIHTSSPLSIQLFRSPIPSDKNRDNYHESCLNSPENDTQLAATANDPIISSPEFQLRFRYPSQFETYSRHDLKKRKLSPSQISFSPKWENRVPSKYGSPSQIPSGNHSSNSSSLTTEKKLEKTGPKYTHLRIKDEKFKKIVSPTQKLALTEEQKSYLEGHVWVKRKSTAAGSSQKRFKKNSFENLNVTINAVQNDNGSKAETLSIRNKDQDFENLKLFGKKRSRSPKHDVEDFESESRDSSKENNGLAFVKDSDLSRNGSTAQNKSKVRIISVEIIKDGRIAKS